MGNPSGAISLQQQNRILQAIGISKNGQRDCNSIERRAEGKEQKQHSIPVKRAGDSLPSNEIAKVSMTEEARRILEELDKIATDFDITFDAEGWTAEDLFKMFEFCMRREWGFAQVLDITRDKRTFVRVRK